MAREIAVFLGEEGITAALEYPGKIFVYRRNQGKWHAVKELPFCLDHSGGMPGVRRQLTAMIADLDNCRVFVACTVTGLLYKELEQAGFSIWEFAGRPQEFLEYVLVQEELAARQPAAVKPVAPAVVETGPGCYQISLKDIQQSGSGLTSKQILQPLLAKNFYMLEVLCSHIPPWLEAEWTCGRLDCRAEKMTEGVKLTIKKQSCG